MLKIVNEDYAENLKYAVTDTTTGELLLAADNLVELFLVLQDCVYTVTSEEANEVIIEERLKHHQRSQSVRKGQ